MAAIGYSATDALQRDGAGARINQQRATIKVALLIPIALVFRLVSPQAAEQGIEHSVAELIAKRVGSAREAHRVSAHGVPAPEGNTLLRATIEKNTAQLLFLDPASAKKTVRRHAFKGGRWALVSNPVWSRDGKSGIVLAADSRGLVALVADGQPQGKATAIPLGFPAGTSQFPDVLQTELLGITAGNEVLARPLVDRWPRLGKARRVPFFKFRLQGRAELRTFYITLPLARDDGAIALSPDGRFLAWYLLNTPEDKSIAAPKAVELAFSEADGSDFAVLGQIVPVDVASRATNLIWRERHRLEFLSGAFRWQIAMPSDPYPMRPRGRHERRQAGMGWLSFRR